MDGRCKMIRYMRHGVTW